MSSGYAFALLSACAMVLFAQDAPPLAGTVNYVEGHVTVDGQALPTNTATASQVAPGHQLQTDQGRAEILLTPGVFLRVAETSTVKMELSSEKAAKVELVRGEALVEVDQVDTGSRIDVIDHGADARLDRPGIYLFNAAEPAIAVYRGKMRVEDDRRVFSLGSGEQLLFGGNAALKPRKFEPTETDAIYEWSLRRADREAQASEWTAEGLLALSGASRYNAGWYWNPWFKSWAFIPATGYRQTPFGYGYYAPNTPHYHTPIFGDFR